MSAAEGLGAVSPANIPLVTGASAATGWARELTPLQQRRAGGRGRLAGGRLPAGCPRRYRPGTARRTPPGASARPFSALDLRGTTKNAWPGLAARSFNDTIPGSPRARKPGLLRVAAGLFTSGPSIRGNGVGAEHPALLAPHRLQNTERWAAHLVVSLTSEWRKLPETYHSFVCPSTKLIDAMPLQEFVETTVQYPPRRCSAADSALLHLRADRGARHRG